MERYAGPCVLATLLTIAPSAFAQEPDLSAVLASNVRCAASAKDDLGYNLQKLTLPPETIGAALNLISSDPARCAPVREAAAALAAAYSAPPAPAPQDLVDAQTRAAVAQTLADADRRAAQLKFEVGPPPRNMTSGRPQRP